MQLVGQVLEKIKTGLSLKFKQRRSWLRVYCDDKQGLFTDSICIN